MARANTGSLTSSSSQCASTPRVEVLAQGAEERLVGG